MTRRGFAAGAVAAVTAEAQTTAVQPKAPISLALIRATAGVKRPRTARLGAADMQPQAAELLIQHLDLDIGFFDFAAPQLRDILAAQPQLQQLDLSVINRVYSDLGIPVPDAAFLSQMAPMMATADVSPLFTADGMRQAAYAALDGPQARPRTTGLMLMEVNPAVVVAGGGTFMVAGGALAGAGIGVATAATTALASAAAAVMVTGGAALFIFGAYMVLKGMGVL